MASTIKALCKADEARCIVCSTGQHSEMLHQALALFGIQPDYEVNIMQANQSLSQLTGSLLLKLDEVVRAVKPDWILAQGDTTTVMVSGLVAYYHGIRFGHIEAGLRSNQKRAPFPEEINRRIADLVADAYFAPTERARQNLLAEGIPDAQIFVTGNPVIDALLDVAAWPYEWASSPIAAVSQDARLVLITAHRRESFGEPFLEMCCAMRDLAARFPDVQFVYPVHLNPNVQQPVQIVLAGIPNVVLLPPLDYAALVQLMKRAALILTDSGGIQEEAPSFGIPVLVMRDVTERPEGIEAGVVKLVGTNRATITAEAARLLSDPAAHAAMSKRVNPYGDGMAAQRIVSVLLNSKDKFAYGNGH